MKAAPVTLAALLCMVAMAGPQGAVATPTTPGLEALAWLEGDWQGEALGGHAQELWMPAAGGMMHAVFRLVVGDAVRLSEYLQVTSEEAGVVMRFAHFRPDYTTWEGDGPPMELRLVAAEEGHARFEALNSKSPDRIDYHLRADGVLEIEVTGLQAPLLLRRAAGGAQH